MMKEWRERLEEEGEKGFFIKLEIGPAQGCWWGARELALKTSHTSQSKTVATCNELTRVGARVSSQCNGAGFWRKGAMGVQGHWH